MLPGSAVVTAGSVIKAATKRATSMRARLKRLVGRLAGRGMRQPPRQRQTLEEGRLYRIEETGQIFQLGFGHRRWFRTIEDVAAVHGQEAPAPVTQEAADRFPVGPPMPLVSAAPLAELLATSDSQQHIREAFCRAFSGRGYEVGAGYRPTVVPADSQVVYIDKFTFEEAKDGSFVSVRNKRDSVDFVSVTYFEAMGDLPSVPSASADFIIACHVIEHVPDAVKALATACDRLKAGKPLFLVVPHRDHMFDRQRPVTSLQHFIADSLSPEPPMLDHYLEYARLSQAREDWIEHGQAMFTKGADFHPHTFTPDSMRELLAHLQGQGMFASFEIKTPARVETLLEFYAVIIQ